MPITSTRIPRTAEAVLRQVLSTRRSGSIHQQIVSTSGSKWNRPWNAERGVDASFADNESLHQSQTEPILALHPNSSMGRVSLLRD